MPRHFVVTPGPDCIRDVVPKVGVRMKVYQAIKRTLEVRCDEGGSHIVNVYHECVVSN